MNIPEHFLTIAEAAEMVGMTGEAVRGRVIAGELTDYRDPGRNKRWIDPSELARISWNRRGLFWTYASESPSGCWLWDGPQVKGYGRWRQSVAHRYAYEQLRAEIPEGLDLDHLCRTPLCINPWHLEPVPRIVNVRRHYAHQTHCKHGHEFTPENTYRRNGHRSCRACTADSQRRYQERKRAS